MFKRKDGRYQEWFTTPSGKRMAFYGKTKAEVLRKIADYAEKEEAGELFEDVAEAWWEETEKHVAFNTTKSYKPAKCRAVEAFGSKPIKDITPAQIAAYIEDFARTRADKTVRTQLMVFNLIFKYAVRKGFVPANTARDLTVPQNLPKRKITAPKPADIAKVKESTKCTFGMFAYWAMYTGMRRGELLALEWEDVDAEARTININKSLYHESNRPIVKGTKTATSNAIIPILDALYKKVDFKKQGLVFPNENGTHMTETQFQRQWELYTKETGITATPHQFRHCFATMLFEAGVPPQEAQALLRHAQIATTMDIYTDIRENKRQEIFNKVMGIDIA